MSQSMPGCCAAIVLSDFNTSDQGSIERWIRGQAIRYKHMKILIATTSITVDEDSKKREDASFGAGHRQHSDCQAAARAALRRCGFHSTKKRVNEAHHHPATAVVLWFASPKEVTDSIGQ